MSFRLRTTKKGLLRATKVFLPILLFALFLLPNVVKAQSTTVGFDQFKCLFERTDTNCSPSSDTNAIANGAASGVLYGQTNTFSTAGISAITMKVGLWVDLAKEKRESKYYFSRVDDSYNSSGSNGPNDAAFFLRFKYSRPGSTTPLYYFKNIPYQEDNVQIQTGWVPGSLNISTVNNGTAQTKFAFYKIGPSGYEVVTQQVVLVKAELPTGVEIPYGADVSAELWYCGGEKQSTRVSVPQGMNPNDPMFRNPVDGRDAPREEGRIEYFTSNGKYEDYLDKRNGTQHSDGFVTSPANGSVFPTGTRCDGEAAYKIGETRDFKLPATQAEAQADSEKTIDSGITNSQYIGSVLPLCSIDPFTDGSVMGCVAQILYGGVFRPVAFFAQLMGKLFDFFLGYSLSDESYRHDFVQTGWQLVRDISNIFFIIIMIWSGLMAVFNTSNVSYKKVIPTLIINALIINFSLFATRIVIDMSNITARIFYNQMVVKVNGEASEGAGGFKPISEAIVSSFNPQKIFEGSVLQSEDLGSNKESETAGAADFNAQSSSTTNGAKFKRYSREYASYFALVTLVAIAITFSVAMMFWKTAFMFVGRVVGLYVAMIFSPFAFLSRGGVPLVSKLPSLNYGSWWKDLSQYALLAPIFVFFLYIINAFLNVEFFTKVGLDQNGQGFFGSVMYVMIPMLIIYGLVSRGASIAKTLAGTYGNMAQDLMGKAGGVVVGGALGIATGGIAVAGRNIVGRLGTRLTSSQSLQNASSRGGIRGALADRVIRSGGSLSRANYDARNVGFINNRLREVGATNTRVGGLLGTNQSNTAGGFQGAINREVATQTARADRMLITGAQAAAQDARNAAWENVYQTARNTAQQTANNTGTVFDETAFRANYTATQAAAGNTRPQTTAEINRQREQQNNARLARPSTLQRLASRVTNRVTTPVGTTGAATSGAGLAAGAATTAITGGLAVAAATVIGQGAIQNAAQEQVARQRAGNARDPIASQRVRLQDRLNQLQAELTRRISVMNNIGAALNHNPPITYATLTPANIIDYQTSQQSEINRLQTDIDNDNDFIDRNKNNSAQTGAVNNARARIRAATNQQNTHRNEMRQAGNILNEYNRIQTDISGTRQSLGI